MMWNAACDLEPAGYPLGGAPPFHYRWFAAVTFPFCDMRLPQKHHIDSWHHLLTLSFSFQVRWPRTGSAHGALTRWCLRRQHHQEAAMGRYSHLAIEEREDVMCLRRQGGRLRDRPRNRPGQVDGVGGVLRAPGSPRPSAPSAVSACRTTRGSAAPTRIPTDCCGSTSRSAATSAR